jgi:hypothetical protein
MDGTLQLTDTAPGLVKDYNDFYQAVARGNDQAAGNAAIMNSRNQKAFGKFFFVA